MNTNNISKNLDILNKNKKINISIIENVNKLSEQAKKFGYEYNSSYSINPPLGNQLLLIKNKN